MGGPVYPSEDPAVCSVTACSGCQNTEKSCGLGIAQASHPTVQALRIGRHERNSKNQGAMDDSRIAQADVSGELSRGVTAVHVPGLFASN